MGQYIKSHSNFRLSSRHQLVNGGVIYERDITTIGGVSPLGAGQSTIYSSGNFIMTINNESSTSRHIIKNNWLSNNSGTVWNGEVLSGETSDINGSVESNISLTMSNDFIDLRSFACYGSLYMLIQNSVSEIIDKFPYELYTGNGNSEYEKKEFTIRMDATEFNADGTVKEDSQPYESKAYAYRFDDYGEPIGYTDESGNPLYKVSNPGGIDIHSNYIDGYVDDELKYFANEGYLNYGFFDDRTESISDDGLDFTWISSQPNIERPAANSESHSIVLSKSSSIETFKLLIFTGDTNVSTISYNGGNATKLNQTYVNGDVLYVRNDESGNTVVTTTYCPKAGDFIAKITIKVENDITFIIYAFWDKDLNIIYGTGVENMLYHLRPKASLGFYDDFIDSLDSFEKALMGVYSHVKNTARFEILNEYDTGVTQTTQVFVFPSDVGDYNVASGGFNMSNYIQKLAKIGLEYDEKYSDNLYRVATHESLKNFDWTRNFNGLSNDLDNEYVESGEKFKSLINIMGYVFDKEKGFIDAIGDVNTLTYDSRANLSSYFLSDSLDNDGWDIHSLYTYDLKEYNTSTNKEVDEVDWSDTNQKYNYFERKFSEITTDIISPWAISDNRYIQTCEGNTKNLILQLVDTDNDYYSDNGSVKNVIKNYYNTTEYTIPDINNEFLKRLKINSHSLLRKKGTIDGVESILSLFGLKSKRWFDSMTDEYGSDYTYTKFDKNLTTKYPYDYSIKEYSSFAEPISETWDSEHNMYRIDYVNSCKTIGYNTTEDDGYIPYQGLPVAYRDLDNVFLCSSGETTSSAKSESDYGEVINARRLYPYFDKDSEYDGDMYYQMYGGWKNIWPYSFSHDDSAILNYDGTISRESLRNVRQVKTMDKLLTIPLGELYENVIYYVNNITTDYAVVDGELYELQKEYDDDGITNYYFTAEVNNNSIILGWLPYEGYLLISNSDYSTERINLNDYEDGEKIKIYYNPSTDSHFTIASQKQIYYITQVVDGKLEEVEVDSGNTSASIKYETQLTPNYTAAFINGSFENDVSDATNYFKLVDGDASNEMVGGWQQLLKTDRDYKVVSSIIDVYQGNNPHCGNLTYDSGYEYMARFDRLFKYALENEYFNYECLVNQNNPIISDAYDEIDSYGFSGLVNSDRSEKIYTQFIHGDNKIHTYTDIMLNNGGIMPYNLDSHSRLDNQLNWSSLSGKSRRDGVTEQVINTKIMDLCFYLKSKEYYSKSCQEEIKHIQEKILPYVEQMIPSSTILKVKFFVYPFNWVFDEDEETDSGQWKEYYYWFEDGQWAGGVRGDINGDGNVNISDYTLLQNMVNGNEPATAAADLNHDGTVNASDINILTTLMTNG